MNAHANSVAEPAPAQTGWRRFFDPARILPAATPRMLAFFRITICSILLISVCWEDLPSVVHLPDGMRQRLGVLGLLESVSFGAFDRLYDSWHSLAALQIAVGIALVAALLGLWTRWSCLAAAVLYLMMGGMIRQYAWFYHTGLVPLYALFALVFTRCGDAWSIDTWRRRRRGLPVPPGGEPRLSDAWSAFAVWIVIAMPYLMAGLSKVRAGIWWFHPNNFKAILLKDALQPMQFSFEFIDLILRMPNWMITGMAITAVAGEIAMVCVLFSKRARLILPIVMGLMHLGIWLLQRVLFFDLILIQLLFLVPPHWFMGQPLRPLVPKTPFWPSGLRWPKPVVGLLAALAVVWVSRLEWYPITDMHMYTRVDTEDDLRYPQIIAHLASGRTVEERPEKVIRAMCDARYRSMLDTTKNDPAHPTAREFFEKCGRLHNERHMKSDPIVAFEVIWRRWDFTDPKQAEKRGKVKSRLRYEVAGATQPPAAADSRDRVTE
jgi:hypothetical protein